MTKQHRDLNQVKATPNNSQHFAPGCWAEVEEAAHIRRPFRQEPTDHLVYDFSAQPSETPLDSLDRKETGRGYDLI